MGPKLVDKLNASEGAKERLRLILETLSGQCTIPEACAKLGIAEARFHEIRNEWLQASVTELEPKPAGRPPATPEEEAVEVAALKHENLMLKVDLRAAQLRERIAILMPHLLKHNYEDELAKKKSPRHKRLVELEAQYDENLDTPPISKTPGKPKT